MDYVIASMSYPKKGKDCPWWDKEEALAEYEALRAESEARAAAEGLAKWERERDIHLNDGFD